MPAMLVREDTQEIVIEEPSLKENMDTAEMKSEPNNDEKKGRDGNDADDDGGGGDLSPRGVLEIPILTSESDQSSTSNNEEDEKSGAATEEQQGGAVAGGGVGHIMVPWKSFMDSFKWRPAKKFPTIPLLVGYESSKKNFRRKLWRNRSGEDTIDCGDFVVPKPSWSNFKYKDLVAATDNFSPEHMLGKGGHAEVYKGCLSDGQIVAVKKILKTNKKDEDRVGDFLAELGIIAHINHPNAAKLIGFSVENGLHLVLQFAPNGSLGSVLHGSTETMEWGLRYKVAIGIAEGLQYLHYDCQRRIIHRDITASNILLMDDFKPQISDFGLAKWLPENWSHHVVSPIEGTFGYMAPEYFMHGVVDEKIDVFAYGVLLLELITGRRAVDSSQQSLVIWAKPLLENDNIEELVDPRLGDNYDKDEMKRAMMAAYACISHVADLRPSMNRVVKVMRGENGSTEKDENSPKLKRETSLDDTNADVYTNTTYLKDLDRHKELVME